LAADFSSDDLEVAYVGGEGNSNNSYEKLFKTEDAGSTWVNLYDGLPNDSGVVYDIAIWPDDPDIVFLAYSGASGYGIYMSADAGSTWTGYEVFDTLGGDSDTLSAAKVIAVDQQEHFEKIYLAEYAPDRENMWYTNFGMDSTWHITCHLPIAVCSDIEFRNLNGDAIWTFSSPTSAGNYLWARRAPG